MNLQDKIAAREQTVLDHAEAFLRKEGWSGFTMDGLLAELDMSRGTLYKHFANREDLGLAVLIRASRRHMEFINRSALYPGNSRMRFSLVISAIKLYDMLQPGFRVCKLDLMGPAVREKAPMQRQVELSAMHQQFLQVPVGIVRDAISSQQLKLEAIRSPEALAFAVWSVQVGVEQIMGIKTPVQEQVLPDAMTFERELTYALLDGYGWKPLSSEYDYYEAVKAALWELYPNECRKVCLDKSSGCRVDEAEG